MTTTITGTWGRNSMNTYQDGWDTYIRNNYQYTNYSTVSGLQVGVDSTSEHFRPLIKFTPSNQIPYTSEILDARLYLYCTEKVSTNYYVTVHRVFKEWVPNEVSWQYYNYSVHWDVVGCGANSDSGYDDGPYDRKSSYEYRRLAAEYSAGNWVSFDVTDLVKKWVNKTAKEYGIVLLYYTNVSSAQGFKFYSFEGTDGYRPYLQITYQLKYKFSGTVLDQGSPAAGRKIVAHKRDTFEPIAYTTTSGDGSYELITTYSGSHYIVCLDDDGGVQYNDKILGRMIPEDF